MNPDIWGPHAWFFLHSITINYPDNPSPEVKDAMKKLINSLVLLLPCAHCQENYTQHLIKYPLTEEILSSRKLLFRWMIDIHNEVNKIHGKKIYSYDEAMKSIKKSYYGETDNQYIKIGLFIVFIIIVFVGINYLRKHNQ